MTRLFDLTIGALALALISPVLILVAVLVRLDSQGPAFFRQRRVGKYGVEFEILKFRSMRQHGPSEPGGRLVTAADDDRITRIGKILRSTKLDELPQLINVVTGDMALVGPRPEVPKYVDHWTAEQREVILAVRPGITDPASIEFRREAEVLASQEDPESYYISQILPTKAKIYVEYVRTKSFRGDLRILLRTTRSVLAG